MRWLNLSPISRTRWKIATAILITLLLCQWIANRRHRQRATSEPPTIQQIELLSTLTTVRIQIADVCEAELRGMTGSESALLVVRGSATVGVDLAKAKFLLIDETKHEACLELPQPEVQTLTLDHTKSRIAALHTSGLWMIVPGDGAVDAIVVLEGFQRGEQVIDLAAHDPTVIQLAREQSVRTMRDVYRSTGWVVKCQWRASKR